MPVAPLISPVLNPNINGASLFTANTFNSTPVTLSWAKPAIGSPYGYYVEILHQAPFVVTNPDGTVTPVYIAYTKLGTAQTSLTLPMPLASGTYFFHITAVADGRANMETSPLRSALPTATADVISAAITFVSSGP
jgi:hypothetical protein